MFLVAIPFELKGGARDHRDALLSLPARLSLNGVCWCLLVFHMCGGSLVLPELRPLCVADPAEGPRLGGGRSANGASGGVALTCKPLHTCGGAPARPESGFRGGGGGTTTPPEVDQGPPEQLCYPIITFMFSSTHRAPRAPLPAR